MKLVVHEKSSKPESMTLKAEPLVIWLDRSHELRIERGDKLIDVASEVEKHWGLSRVESRSLVAFWFAIGERQDRKKLGAGWNRAELSVDPSRQYLR